MRACLPILLVLVAPCALSQPSEVYLDQAGSSTGVALPLLEGDARALVSALEAADVAALASVRVEGHHNVANIVQGAGGGNRAGLVLLGDGNAVSLTQWGSDNSFVALITGTGNRVADALQAGDGNAYMLALEGDFHVDHTVLQIGNGNSAVQVVAAGSSPISVVQTGAAEAVIIRR